MKKTIFGGWFLTIFVIAIFGCKKTEVKAVNKMEINTVNNESKRLTMDQLEKIGIDHNSYIIEAVDNLKKSKIEISHESIMNEFRKVNLDLKPINTSVNEIVDNTVNNKYSDIDFREKDLDTNITEKIEYYLNLMVRAVVEDYDQTIINYNKIKKSILNDEDITDFEYNLLIGSIEVGKNSADLWMNKINNLLPNEKVQKPTSQSTVRADASASMGYMLGVASMGPIGWLGATIEAPAFLGGWAFTAALGSAQHYFGF